ncbi:unnamed protein product [Pleuronectes platessa]|uniref:Uncharacterized protein n=1 Tax=Pleuronectes platessa TaxID=8262 RepID=A0A9N7UVP4_PLEPL|nr:unnamed protein product [Pleuronectes platessa]
MSAARKALRGASERHGEGVPRWRGRSYLSVSVKTQKHTLALSKHKTLGARESSGATGRERRHRCYRAARGAVTFSLFSLPACLIYSYFKNSRQQSNKHLIRLSDGLQRVDGGGGARPAFLPGDAVRLSQRFTSAWYDIVGPR